MDFYEKDIKTELKGELFADGCKNIFEDYSNVENDILLNDKNNYTEKKNDLLTKVEKDKISKITNVIFSISVVVVVAVLGILFPAPEALYFSLPFCAFWGIHMSEAKKAIKNEKNNKLKISILEEKIAEINRVLTNDNHISIHKNGIFDKPENLEKAAEIIEKYDQCLEEIKTETNDMEM